MIRETAEGLPPVDRHTDTAPNEEPTGIMSSRDAARRGSGWDPYEVWRTRVKATSVPQGEAKNPERLPQ